MSQQTFTRKEVRTLLKKQLQAVVESYKRMPITDEDRNQLCFGMHSDQFWDYEQRCNKRLKNVNIIKF
jgi:hypothetical protein